MNNSMKFKILYLLLALSMSKTLWGVTITTGHSFTNSEQVTAQKMNDMINNATITSIQNSDIADGAIGNSKLGANSVTTDKILDGTILGADIANRTLSNSLYATNSVDEIALSTNIFFRAGFLSLSNATLLFSANQIPYSALPVGTVTNTSPTIITNVFLTAEIPATANAWTNLVSITFPFTNGMVSVSGRIDLKSKDSTITTGKGARLISITPGATNTLVETSGMTGNQVGPALSVQWMGTIVSTNTFIIQGISVTGDPNLVWGGNAKDYYLSPVGTGAGGTNGTSLLIMRIPP